VFLCAIALVDKLELADAAVKLMTLFIELVTISTADENVHVHVSVPFVDFNK
jgi:hypothetical protein